MHRYVCRTLLLAFATVPTLLGAQAQPRPPVSSCSVGWGGRASVTFNASGQPSTDRENALAVAVAKGELAAVTVYCDATGYDVTSVDGGTRFMRGYGDGPAYTVPVKTGLNTITVHFTRRDGFPAPVPSITWTLPLTAWVYSVEPWGKLERPPFPTAPSPKEEINPQVMDAAGNMYARVLTSTESSGLRGVARYAPGGKLAAMYDIAEAQPWAEPRNNMAPRCFFPPDTTGSLFIEAWLNLIQYNPSGKFIRSLGGFGQTPLYIRSPKDLDQRNRVFGPHPPSPFGAVSSISCWAPGEIASFDGATYYVLGTDTASAGRADQTFVLVRFGPTGAMAVMAKVTGPGRKYLHATSVVPAPDGNIDVLALDQSRRPSIVTFTQKGEILRETPIPDPRRDMLGRLIGIDGDGGFYSDSGSRVSQDFTAAAKDLRAFRFRAEHRQPSDGDGVGVATDLLSGTRLSLGALPKDKRVWFDRGSVYVLYDDMQVAKFTLQGISAPPPSPKPAPNGPDLRVDRTGILIGSLPIKACGIEPAADQQTVGVNVQNVSKTTAALNVEVQLFEKLTAGGPAVAAGKPVQVGDIAPGAWGAGCTYWDLKGQNVIGVVLTARASTPGVDDANPSDNEASVNVSISYAHNGTRAFSYKDDTYSFENFGSAGREMEDWVEGAVATAVGSIPDMPEYSARVLKRFAFAEVWKQVSVYSQESLNSTMGGHCYGMSATSGLYFEGTEKPPLGLTTPQLRAEDASPAINVYHRAQMVSVLKWLLDGANSNGPAPLYQARVEGVQNTLNWLRRALEPSRLAPIVEFFGEENARDKDGNVVIGANGKPVRNSVGHAVLAYKLVEVEGVDPKVYVYDSNYPLSALTSDRSMPSFDLSLSKNAWLPDAYTGYAGWAYSTWISAHRVFREIPIESINVLVPRIKALVALGLQTYSSVDKMLAVLRCPAEIVFTDSQGRRTGVVNGKPINEIPGAEVLASGEAKMFTLPAGRQYATSISGTDKGSMGLDVFRVADGQLTMHSVDEVPLTKGASFTGAVAASGALDSLKGAARTYGAAAPAALDVAAIERLAVSSPRTAQPPTQSQPVTSSRGGAPDRVTAQPPPTQPPTPPPVRPIEPPVSPPSRPAEPGTEPYRGPLNGRFEYSGPPIVQNGEVVVRNLPLVALEFDYDRSVWEGREESDRFNGHRLILRNLKSGSQKTCVVTWRVKQ